MVDIFNYADPVSYLNDLISESKNSGVIGLTSRLAKAADCQVSYFSQFLKFKNSLSFDHIIGISDFLGHSTIESDYFFNLFTISKAGTMKLKDRFKSKNEALKTQHLSISGRINNSKSVVVGAPEPYYYSWINAAIHMALSVPELNSVQTLSQRFEISEEKVREALNSLEQMNFIYKENGVWVLKDQLFHLSEKFPITAVNHLVWRSKAINNIEKEEKGSLNYSSSFAMSQTDYIILKKYILNFISEVRIKVQDSDPEDVFCLNVDFFRV